MNKVKSVLFSAGVLLALAFTFGCSSGGGNDGDGWSGNGQGACPNDITGNGTVSCDGQTYKTVVIGDQTWMAENLNYDVTGSKCYDNNEANCMIYGRLYDWATAMGLPSSCNSNSCASQVGMKHRGICPNGWHIPSTADWDRLYRYADGTSGTSSPYVGPTAGRYLKATDGWNSGGNGEDTFGFSALPGGFGSSDGYFFYVGNLGNWWSASEISSGHAYARGMYYLYEYASYNDNDKIYLFSVRCVKD